MSFKQRIHATLGAVIATTLVTTAALAQTPYDEGQKALREQRWMEAAGHFEEAQAGERGAAAMYWRAHALYKAGRRGEAERQIRDLETIHPDSSWVHEARALQIEHGEGDAGIEEDELRLFALSSLMHKDAARAMPMVLELMRTTNSENVRRDAMFLLGVSDHPEANAAIAELARNSADPSLQRDAIHMLGASATPSALALLRDLYYGADSEEVREAIIHAHIAAGDAAPLMEFLGHETSPGLQRDLIHALGISGATAELEALYPNLESRETRIAALEAMAISGEAGMLKTVLETETDPELRRTAIEGIAMTGGEDAAEFLSAAYDAAASREEKIALLESLAILGGGEEIALRVVQDESDPGLQRRAIEMLGVIGATERLDALYHDVQDREVRRTVLESMMIAGNADGLVAVLGEEQDPEMRIAAIHALAVMDREQAAPILVDLYPAASYGERRALVESMLIMDDAPSLIRLLEQEDDTALRREMLQTLSIMDDERATEYLFQMLEQGG